jgi:hypothetical protein
MTKKLSALVLCLLWASAAPLYAQLPTSGWINVMDFGAKGDRVTDDTQAIFNAIKYGIQQGKGVVYFPPGHCFLIANAQTLPPLNNAWMTLFLDSCLILGGTLTVSGAYVIHGNSSGQFEAFSMDTLALIEVLGHPSSAININAAGVRLENLQFSILPEGSDGIVLQRSARVALKNVWVSGQGGIPLRINGGFGFEIEGGGFSNTEAVPSIEFTDNNECTLSGLLRVRGTFLAQRGILVKATCGGVNSMTFDNILYEDAQNALLTLDSHSNVAIFGISIRDVILADSVARPFPPIIDVHCPRQLGCGGGVNGVTIANYSADGDVVTTGDTIRDLEVWDPYGVGSIAQSTDYIHHTPFGIIDTMPVDRPFGQKDFALNPYSQSTVTVKAGDGAQYQIEIIPSGGFDQNVTLSCSGVPPGSSCGVSPNPAAPFSLPVVGVQTTARASQPVVRRSRPGISGRVLSSLVLNILMLTLLASFLGSRRNARPAWSHAFALLVLACVVVLSASCSAVVASGSHDGNSSPATQGSAPGTQAAASGTPPGTYPMTITGVATLGTTTVTHTTQITVVVQ